MLSIIDDDESVRAATQCLLRSLGYVTHTFASAEEFLLSPYVSETSCVIADVHMPKMSGLELQSRLRAKGHRTPIIFMTAFPEEKLRARALQGGAVLSQQAFRGPSPDRLRRNGIGTRRVDAGRSEQAGLAASLTSDAFATRSQIVHPEEPFGRGTHRENFPALVGSLARSSRGGFRG
jgi:CheY-like chemotaxis protein